MHPLSGNPLEILDETYSAITTGMGLLYGENCIILTSTVIDCVIDKTYGQAIAYSALFAYMLLHAKNQKN